MDIKLEEKLWWGYVDVDLKELLKESLLLIKSVPDWKEQFHDYSFVVFPAAKAYEGYLKKVFYDLGFISKNEYMGNRLRIGMVLNPSLDREKYRGRSVYDMMVDFCQGEDLAKVMWDTWKGSRNMLFHWFPDEVNAIDFEEAKERVRDVINTMDLVFRECKIEDKQFGN
jgi:hypothetical protein